MSGSSTTPVNLTERITYLIKDYLVANLPNNLTYVRSDRNTDVNITPPNEYLMFFPAHAFRAPALFIVCDSIDMMLDRGQNHINAEMKYFINVVVEERDLERLQKLAWRYQDAMFKTLDQVVFEEETKFKAVVKITRVEYSGDYSYKNESSSLSSFRKEMLLELQVEQYQQN